MTETRPHVLIACNSDVRQRYVTAPDLERLERFAIWQWVQCEGGRGVEPNEDPDALARLLEAAPGADAIVVCHGAPRIDARVMDRAPRLRFIGELEGDRFAYRIDVEEAWRRGIRAVDTTQGSSYPVAEWALALILISLRNAGEQFRHMIQHKEYRRPRTDFGYLYGELTGKTVGLIGCGHIGRRLISFLRPFQCTIFVYDPYLPKEIADVLGFTLTSLEYVFAHCDVVVCLAPLTPATRRMIGRRELELLHPGSVFVNVSRGAIVDSDALIERLRRGDIVAGLDVFDPEPIPADSPIKDLPNVFLTPHIAGVTAASGPRFFRLMVDELERFFHGHETLYDLLPRTLANRRGEPPNSVR
jgi:phosphoglycerate dehydrogenase-like enzyme